MTDDTLRAALPTRFTPSEINRLIWDLRRAVEAGDGLAADQLHSKLVALAASATDDLVLVRKDSGGVFLDGTTNHPAIDFGADTAASATDERQPDGCTCIGDRWRKGDHAPYCALAASATDEHKHVMVKYDSGCERHGGTKASHCAGCGALAASATDERRKRGAEELAIQREIDGSDIPTYLAASATDEGPHTPGACRCGETHDDEPSDGTLARPAVPALDAMTLGRAMDFVDREDEALGVVGRGRKVDRIIEAYAALRSKECEHGIPAAECRVVGCRG